MNVNPKKLIIIIVYLNIFPIWKVKYTKGVL